VETTFTGAYAKAGYTVANPRNQWSAIKEDGSGVALTVWSDEIDESQEPWRMDLRNHKRIDVWRGKVGNKVRLRHLCHAMENLEGRVDLILCIARDVDENPRRVKSARPWYQRQGRLVAGTLNSLTGEFLIEFWPLESP
jgi:hypothetical protein